MTYKEVSLYGQNIFIICYCEFSFITMSIALQILGFYFTTAIGSAALLAMVTFIYLDKYFFQEIKTDC